MKEIPFVETLSNSTIIYLVFMLGFTHNALPFKVPANVYYLLVLATGLNAYHTIVDFKSDLVAGHRTFATRFGKRATAGFAFFCCLVPLFFGRFESIEFRLLVWTSAAAVLMTLIYPRIAKFVMYIGGFWYIGLAISWLVRTWI